MPQVQSGSLEERRENFLKSVKAKSIPCRWFGETGTCRFGDKCVFKHIARPERMVLDDDTPLNLSVETSGRVEPCGQSSEATETGEDIGVSRMDIGFGRSTYPNPRVELNPAYGFGASGGDLEPENGDYCILEHRNYNPDVDADPAMVCLDYDPWGLDDHDDAEESIQNEEASSAKTEDEYILKESRSQPGRFYYSNSQHSYWAYNATIEPHCYRREESRHDEKTNNSGRYIYGVSQKAIPGARFYHDTVTGETDWCDEVILENLSGCQDFEHKSTTTTPAPRIIMSCLKGSDKTITIPNQKDVVEYQKPTIVLWLVRTTSL